MNKVRYYTDYTNYPEQIQAIMERLRIFICSSLFYEEDITESISRAIYADIANDGSDEAIRRATEIFKNSNQQYPFVAFSLDTDELQDRFKTAYAKNMIFYHPDLETYVSSKPAKFIMPMISFFNTPYDYQIAKKILFKITCSPTRLEVPITINGTVTTFPIEVSFPEIGKGSYAHNFQEMLRAGSIYDLQHFAEISYQDLELDTSEVYQVDDMIFELNRLAEEDMSLSDELDQITINYDTQLSSSDPAHNATNVPVDNSILLTFNVGMYEKSVEDAITLDPFFSAEYTWNDTSTILLIDPVYNFSSGTVYTVEIDGDAYSWYNNEPISNTVSGVVTIVFTTEGV